MLYWEMPLCFVLFWMLLVVEFKFSTFSSQVWLRWVWCFKLYSPFFFPLQRCLGLSVDLQSAVLQSLWSRVINNDLYLAWMLKLFLNFHRFFGSNCVCKVVLHGSTSLMHLHRMSILSILYGFLHVSFCWSVILVWSCLFIGILQ